MKHNILLIALLITDITVTAQKRTTPHHLTSTCLYDSIVAYSSNASPPWQNKNITYYNVNGYETSFLNLSWNGSQWVNYSRDTIIYNSSNDEIDNLSQTWNGTQWENSSRDTIIYNSSNDMLSDLNQNWNVSKWINNALYSYSYNSSNDKMTYLYQSWDSTTKAWVNAYLDSMAYNSSNHLTSDVDLRWNGSTWNYFMLTTYTYNTNNKVTSMLNQNWSGGIWYNGWLTTYSYNSNNDLISTVEQNWNYPDSTWRNSDSTSYAFNSNNVNTSYNYFTWNFADTTWFDGGPDGYAALCSNNTCYSTAVDKNPSTSYYTDVTSGWHSYGADSILFYGCSVAGILPVAENNIGVSVYPNPTGDEITIESLEESRQSSVEIYDMLGQKVFDAHYSLLNSKVLINISNLAQGMYFAEVITDKGSQAVKFIKK
jgi:hypothetical protein